jgi:hypothetical protein
VFDRFDEDGDDQLSREEFTRLTERMRERFEGGPQGRGPRGPGFEGGRRRGGPEGGRPQRPEAESEDEKPADSNST